MNCLILDAGQLMVGRLESEAAERLSALQSYEDDLESLTNEREDILAARDRLSAELTAAVNRHTAEMTALKDEISESESRSVFTPAFSTIGKKLKSKSRIWLTENRVKSCHTANRVLSLILS
jgi:chromosome segregation ATPase